MIGADLVSATSEECDIEAILAPRGLPSGALALDRYSDAIEVDEVLLPVEIEAGTYDVSLTRETDDLYSIVGETLYIKTRYCYEYAIRDDAVLKIESLQGYTLGKLIFVD